MGRRRRKEDKRRAWREKTGEPGSREEQDNNAQDFHDTDEQQRCIVSRYSSFNPFVPLE